MANTAARAYILIECTVWLKTQRSSYRPKPPQGREIR